MKSETKQIVITINQQEAQHLYNILNKTIPIVSDENKADDEVGRQFLRLLQGNFFSSIKGVNYP